MNGTARAFVRSLLSASVVMAMFASYLTPVQAQTAPANTSIGNQASASYTDGSNTTRTTTSNTVVTTVTQVGSFTLTANNNKVANPGSPVYYPHTITNTGNGTDTFGLAAANTAGFALAGLAVYADADGNGVPDSTTTITSTTPLATGQSFRFVVAGTVPATATTGQTGTVTVTGSSSVAGTANLTNLDTVTVTNNASIEIVKSISANSGPAGTSGVVYTLTYRNTGNSAAGNLVITDTVPTGMTLVPNSGRWSKSATALTDASDGTVAATDGTTINYTAAGTPSVVTATISSVAPQTSGTVSFTVNVNAGLAPQTINNQATFAYNDNGGTTANQNGNSNTVPFTITRSAGVTLTGASTDPATPVNQGSAVPLTNVVRNTGNAPDTFDITLNQASSTYPAGTTFKLFKSDGTTPLVDTNNNGVPDTGVINPNTNYNVVLVVQLPPASAGGPYTINKTATSTNDPSVTATAADTVSAIAANTVDITNGGVAGAGPGTDTVITPLSGVPGSTLRFTIEVRNTGATADSYALQYSNTAVFTPAAALPAGFTVTFRNAAGAVVTNTGTLAPNGLASLFADVFIPSNASPGNVEVYFRAVSPTSGVSDYKHDRVTVNNARALTVEPNNFGQVFPGGTIVYPHVIKNNGNVAETNIALTIANSFPGFTAVVYLDGNGTTTANGTLEPGETTTPLTNIPNIPAGGSISVLVKVFAPAGVDPNTQNVTTLTGTAASGQTDNATDTTTVVSGDLKIEKFQSVDADGAGAGGYTAFSKSNSSAAPGAFIRYRIIVTNTGNVPVTNVVVNDSTPGYTTYSSAVQPATVSVNGGATAPPTTPAVIATGYSGTLAFTVGTLAPGESAQINFGVVINP